MLAHYVFDGLGDDTALSDVADEIKWACATMHLELCADELRDAVDAVVVARKKGYRTPREPGQSTRVATGWRPERFTAEEQARAAAHRRAIGGCPHSPPCATVEACYIALIRRMRRPSAS